MKKPVVYAFLALLFTSQVNTKVFATTWAPKEVVCPLCQTKNTFQEPMSWGSYVYNWPEKFQYIFWPLTDKPVLYCCKKCHLTAFMWDYASLPKEKFPAFQKTLEGVKIEGAYKEYTDIPMTQRLVIAEKVYAVLDRPDMFWCQFYRVVGFHAEAEKKVEAANEARKKALTLAEKLLADAANTEIRKELLLVSGAMKHFLKDDAAALTDFKQAQGLKYRNAKLEKEAAENVDNYLSALLDEYIKKLQSAK